MSPENWCIKGFQTIFDLSLNIAVENIWIPDENKSDKIGFLSKGFLDLYNPFCISHEFKAKISHNFAGGFCKVPINVTIKNILSSNPVSFEVITGNLKWEKVRAVKSKNDFFWSGISRKNVP